MTRHKRGGGKAYRHKSFFSQRRKVTLVGVGSNGDRHKPKTFFDQEAENKSK
jgi:hypothetical protein